MRINFWSLLFGGTVLAMAGFTALAPLVGWWMPRNVSGYGDGVDGLFYLILVFTTIFFVLTQAILVYNMAAFAGHPGAPRKAKYIHGNHVLELVWTSVPGVILVFLAFWQIGVWAEIKYPGQIARQATADALQVEVSGRQWEWRVRYPSVKRLASWRADKTLAAEEYRRGLPEHLDDVRVPNELHVAMGQNVLVHLKTQDVIHSFFLPNLRLKQDALPGKTIPVWFRVTDYNTRFDPDLGRWVDGFDPVLGRPADDAGRFWDVDCAEFCGARHSLMRGKLFVHKDRDDFVAWLGSAQARQDGTHEPPAPAQVTENPAAGVKSRATARLDSETGAARER